MHTVVRKSGVVSIFLEQLLDALGGEIALSTGKERVTSRLSDGKILSQECRSIGQQRPLTASAIFQPSDKKGLVTEIHI